MVGDRGRSECALDNTELQLIQTLTGCTFDHDACCADDGSNALCASFSSPSSSFLTFDCAGRSVWLNPPFKQAAQFLKHYHTCKAQAPAHTSCCIVLPKVSDKFRPASWTPMLKHMELVRQYPKGAAVLTDNGRLVRTPLPLEVWYDAPGVHDQRPDPRAQRLAHVAATISSTTVSSPCDAFCMAGAGPAGLSLLFDAQLAGRRSRTVLVDTGASHNFISMVFAKLAGLRIQPSPLHTVGMANSASAQIKGMVQVPARMGRYRSVITAHVMDPIIPGVDLILGNAWLTSTAGMVQYSDRPDQPPMLKVKSQGGTRVRIHARSPEGDTQGQAQGVGPKAAQRGSRSPQPKACTFGPHEDDRLDLLNERLTTARAHDETVPIISAKAAKKLMRSGARTWAVYIHGDEPSTCATTAAQDARPTESPSTPAYLPSQAELPEGTQPCHLQELEKLITQYSDVAPADAKAPDGLPPYRGFEIEAIRLQPGAVVPKPRIRRHTPKELDACKEYISDLLKKGWISPAQPEYASQVLFVDKPGGGLRCVIDARAINKATVPVHYHLPEVSELLDKLQGKHIFSTIDLISGYNQLRLLPSDVPKTGMITPLGSYVWHVLPMGTRNASAIYQATMEKILAPLIAKGTVHIFQDDCCIASSTPEEHLRDLQAVFALLRQHKLYVNVKKLRLFRSSVKWLGFVVSRDGLAMDPAKISSIEGWPQPKDAHQLRQFLGLANYFRKFIQGMASMAAPLNDLLHNSVASFKDAWTQLHTDSFLALKKALCSPPVLKLPDFGKPFTVISDASLLGTGGLLMQEGHPVAYTSKKFTPAERNYTTTEQEMLGVIRALTEWRYACEGPQITVQTDHNPLVYLPEQAQVSRRCARWLEFLSRFNIKWEYKPGRTNIADPLSRNPALAMGVVAAYACMVTTRSHTGTSKPAQKAQRAAPQLPQRTRDAAQRNSSQNPASPPAQEQPDAPLPPFLDLIKAGYNQDPSLQDPAVRSRFEFTDSGLIMVSGKVYVPEVDTLRMDIIDDLHSATYAGHLGTDKTLDAVRRWFWWDGMRGDVLDFVRCCHSCQTNKAPTGKPPGLMQPVEIPAQPWECVTSDFITDLPVTKSGHTAIITFCCKLTDMAHFVPCTKHVTAQEYAWHFLNAVVRLHGLPTKLLTDRDPRFTRTFMTELCNLVGTRQAFSTAFHPCTDGTTERKHRTIQQMLRHFVNEAHDNWDRVLPAAEFAVNNAVQDSRRHTPFYINYGFHPRTPLSVDIPATTGKNPAALAWLSQQRQALKRARECLEAAQASMKARADKSRRDVHFAVGDKVLLNTKHLKQAGSRKFAPRWTGPFTVSALVGAQGRPAVAAKLDLPVAWRIHPVFHVSLLKHYRSDGRSRPAPPPLYYDADGQAVWEVSHLLDERTNPTTGEKEYQVRWKGYAPDEDSWSRESDILDKSLIADLHARMAQPKRRRVMSALACDRDVRI